MLVVTLATNWDHILTLVTILWLIGWGIRALLVGLLLGGLYWIYRHNR
ncbi:hypothetical protein KB236_03710 [Levilactobacillus brevis]|nr:hypothetical protein KB236_03710 [Levilactobacillus brevis]